MSSRNPLVAASCAIGAPLVLNGLSIPATAYIIRTLGPEAYGSWALGMALIALVQVLTNLGLRTMFVRAVATDLDAAPQAFAEQLGLRLMLAGLGGVIALALCAILRYPPLVFVCTALAVAGLILTTVAFVAADLLQALERLPESSAINLSAGLVLTASSVAAMALKTGPIGLSVAYVLGPLACSVLSLILLHRLGFSVRPKVSWSRSRQLMREASGLGASLCIWGLSQHIVSLLVPKLLGIVPYGYFAAGSMPATRLNIVPDGFGSAFYPRIVRRYQEGPIAARREVIRLVAISAVTCSALALVIMAAAPLISRILFPTSYQVCTQVMQITIWMLPVLGVYLAMYYSLNAAGKQAELGRLTIVASVLSLVLSLVLIALLGLIGACVSLIARNAILMVILFPCFWRTYFAAPGSVLTDWKGVIPLGSRRHEHCPEAAVRGCDAGTQ